MKKIKESISSFYGLPDELGEKLSNALDKDYESFYKKLVEALDKSYDTWSAGFPPGGHGNALDCLSHWYDHADSINEQYPSNNYPWYDEYKVDFWGDGVKLGGELLDKDEESVSKGFIAQMMMNYVDHADTDFWRFLYKNWSGFEDFLDEVNGFALVRESRMKIINENTKVTLTVGQLKKLVKESDGRIDPKYFTKKSSAKKCPNYVDIKKALWNDGDVSKEALAKKCLEYMDIDDAWSMAEIEFGYTLVHSPI